MKKTVIILIAAALMLAFTACAAGNEAKDDAVQGEVLSFTTTDVNGSTVSSKDIFSENKVTMINVWASWCGPCVGELDELEELGKTLSEMDCTLIGILDDGDEASGLEAGKTLISAHGLTYTVLIPNDEIHSQLSYMYYPTTFFVDSSGRMIGEPIIGAQVDKYLPAIQKLLADMN